MFRADPRFIRFVDGGRSFNKMFVFFTETAVEDKAHVSRTTPLRDKIRLCCFVTSSVGDCDVTVKHQHVIVCLCRHTVTDWPSLTSNCANNPRSVKRAATAPALPVSMPTRCVTDIYTELLSVNLELKHNIIATKQLILINKLIFAWSRFFGFAPINNSKKCDDSFQWQINLCFDLVLVAPSNQLSSRKALCSCEVIELNSNRSQASWFALKLLIFCPRPKLRIVQKFVSGFDCW